MQGAATLSHLAARRVRREQLAAWRLLGEADHIGHGVGARAEDENQGRRAHLRHKKDLVELALGYGFRFKRAQALGLGGEVEVLSEMSD